VKKYNTKDFKGRILQCFPDQGGNYQSAEFDNC